MTWIDNIILAAAIVFIAVVIFCPPTINWISENIEGAIEGPKQHVQVAAYAIGAVILGLLVFAIL